MKLYLVQKHVALKAVHLSIELHLLDVTFLFHMVGGRRREDRGVADNRDTEGRGGRRSTWHRAVTLAGAQELETGDQEDLVDNGGIVTCHGRDKMFGCGLLTVNKVVVWYGFIAGDLTAVAVVMMCVAAGPGTNCLHCSRGSQLPAWLQ